MQNKPTKITYRIVDGTGELRTLVRGKAHRLEVTIEPAADGYLAIGGAVVKVKGGRAELNLSLLDEGILTPSFASDERVPLESVLYDKGRIYTMPVSEEALRRVLIRLERAENENAALCERVSQIEKKLGAPLLF